MTAFQWGSVSLLESCACGLWGTWVGGIERGEMEDFGRVGIGDLVRGGIGDSGGGNDVGGNGNFESVAYCVGSERLAGCAGRRADGGCGYVVGMSDQ